MLGRIARNLAALALAFGAYYLLPLDAAGGVRPAVVLAATALGTVVLAAMIVALVLRQARAEARVLPVTGLLLALYVVVVLFAAAYYVLARSPGQLEGLRTRTDALYFTVSTLATVGFGDVHATGQAARATVVLQIAFDLGFVAVAATAITTTLRRRFAAHERAR